MVPRRSGIGPLQGDLEMGYFFSYDETKEFQYGLRQVRHRWVYVVRVTPYLRPCFPVVSTAKYVRITWVHPPRASMPILIPTDWYSEVNYIGGKTNYQSTWGQALKIHLQIWRTSAWKLATWRELCWFTACLPSCLYACTFGIKSPWCQTGAPSGLKLHRKFFQSQI